METLGVFGDEIGLTNGSMESLQNLSIQRTTSLSPDDSGDHQAPDHTAAIS